MRKLTKTGLVTALLAVVSVVVAVGLAIRNVFSRDTPPKPRVLNPGDVVLPDDITDTTDMDALHRAQPAMGQRLPEPYGDMAAGLWHARTREEMPRDPRHFGHWGVVKSPADAAAALAYMRSVGKAILGVSLLEDDAEAIASEVARAIDAGLVVADGFDFEVRSADGGVAYTAQAAVADHLARFVRPAADIDDGEDLSAFN